MIKFLGNWIEQVAIAVVIVSIFELILPNGNIKKYIKVVLGIYIVFCIISPFVNANSLFNLNELDKYYDDKVNIASTQNELNQESMDERLKTLYLEQLEKDMNKQINNFGYNIYKCKIDADLENSSENPGIHSINLTLKSNGIINVEKVDINVNSKNNEKAGDSQEVIQKIQEELANHYEIDKDIIKIKLIKN